MELVNFSDDDLNVDVKQIHLTVLLAPLMYPVNGGIFVFCCKKLFSKSCACDSVYLQSGIVIVFFYLFLLTSPEIKQTLPVLSFIYTFEPGQYK